MLCDHKTKVPLKYYYDDDWASEEIRSGIMIPIKEANEKKADSACVSTADKSLLLFLTQ